MSCLSQIFSAMSYVLEQLGVYEPELDINEATRKLRDEQKTWEKLQPDRALLWFLYQKNNPPTNQSNSLVSKAVAYFRSQNISQQVAVDFGCGINTSMFQLLQEGWKVYAVDSSTDVINYLNREAKEWIKKNQLILCNQKIEDFTYKEKVNLIIAIDSLPYCSPGKITEIFLNAKNNLLSKGILVCTFFPYATHEYTQALRDLFGAWMTTKNVVEALIKYANFSSWSVTTGTNRWGSKQFHVVAYMGKEHEP